MEGRARRTGAAHGAIVIALVLGISLPAAAVESLPGDVNGDGLVTAQDLVDLTQRVFDADFAGAPGADANRDSLISSADFPRTITALALFTSPTPTRTPSSSPTATHTSASVTPRTASPSPTATVPSRSPTPTATPTSTACAPRALQVTTAAPVTVGGSLGQGDCHDFSVGAPPGKVYSVAANPGQALAINVISSDFTPRVVVLDSGGYFGIDDTTPPTEFLATTTQPYVFLVTGDRTDGFYALTVSVRNCRAPTTVTPTASGAHPHNTILKETDCPAPNLPDTPANVFTFSAQAGTAVSIAMSTAENAEQAPDPSLTLYGPTLPGAFTGIRLANDEDSGGGPNGTDALLSFYAVESGTYTVVATSFSGDMGSYTITFSLPQCTVSAAAASAQPLTRTGTLNDQSCPAPLPVPSGPADNPSGQEPNSVADVLTLDADAGDVIAANLTSRDFTAHLYLLGPDHTLLAENENGSESAAGGAQLAFTAAATGSYTLIAASDNAGVTGAYAIELQRCPAIPLTLGTPVHTSFGGPNCRDTGGHFISSYKFDGTAGQFVTATMVADSAVTFDPTLTLVAPSGERVIDNDDPLLAAVVGADSRVSWVLPRSGRYFLSAGQSLDSGPVAGDYTIAVHTCRTIPVTPAGVTTVTGGFEDDDCATASGAKFNVFTITTGANQALSVMPPAGGCAVATSPDGVQGPVQQPEQCLTTYFAMPLVRAGTTALLIAASDPTTRGSYTFRLSTCPAIPLDFSTSLSGFILGNNCRDAAGTPTDFYLFRTPRSLAVLTGTVTGSISTTFGSGPAVADNMGSFVLSGYISEDYLVLFSLGSDAGFLLLAAPANPSARGTYTITTDPAVFDPFAW